MTWFRDLSAGAIAPSGLREWAEHQPSAATAWRSCPRADWQLWLASRARNLAPKEQREIISSALRVVPDPPFAVWLLGFAKPLPSALDVLEAWSRDRHGKLGDAQRMTAGNFGFMLALIAALVIDRVWGARLGVGTARTAAQAAIVVAIWIPLIPLMRAIWRARIDRYVSQLSFADAFERIWPRIVKASESASVADRASQADTVRVTLSGLATRAFS